MYKNYVSKKTFYITIGIIFGFMLLYLWSSVYIINIRDKALSNEIEKKISILASSNLKNERENISHEDDKTPTILYIIGEHEGKIGIYDAVNNNLIETLDVYIESLPEKDKEYLKKGIEVYTQNQLLSVIQDYTS